MIYDIMYQYLNNKIYWGSLLPPQWVLYNSIRKIEQIHLSRSVLQGSHC
jgi:hypothetical protein